MHISVYQFHVFILRLVDTVRTRNSGEPLTVYRCALPSASPPTSSTICTLCNHELKRCISEEMPSLQHNALAHFMLVFGDRAIVSTWHMQHTHSSFH